MILDMQSQPFRMLVYDSASTTGGKLTGISSATSGLQIAVQADNEAAPTLYTVAGSTIEAVTTLGTYSAPTATKCRIKKIDDTNCPGEVEVQVANARFSVASAKTVTVTLLVPGGVCAPRVFQVGPAIANTKQVLDTAVTAATAGVQDVNVKNINNVSASAVTAINANVGTTQPVNFTGTAGSANVKADTKFWNGTATLSAAGGYPDVNVAKMNGVGTGNIVTVNGIIGTTQAIAFTSGSVQVDVVKWMGTATLAPSVAGVPITDTKYLNGGTFTLGGAGGLPQNNASGWVPAQLYTFDSGTIDGSESRLSDFLANSDALSGNAASAATDAAGLRAAYTDTRAALLDNLDVGGPVASHADVIAINQSASKHMTLATVGQYERPESGTVTYTIEMRTYAAATGAAVNADSTPTVTPQGIVSGSLAANLSAATNPATGVYRWTYTAHSTDTIEQIRMDGAATIGAVAYTLSAYTQVADFVATTFTTADRTALNATATATALAAVSTKIGTPAGATIAADVAAVKGDTASLLTNLASLAGKFTGITSLANWLKALLRSSAADSTAASEIGGTYDGTTDSLQAIRDRGDAAWIGGGGGGIFTGARAVTITVFHEDGTTPAPAARVRITQGVVTDIKDTNSGGQVLYSLDDGAFQLSITKGGYDFTPAAITVSSSATSFSASLTAVVLPIATNPLQTRCVVVCYDQQANVDADAKITIQQSAAGAAGAWTSDLLIVSCNGSGVVIDPVDGNAGVLLARDVSYRAHRGEGAAPTDTGWVTFIPTGASFALPSMLGRDT